jgi:Tfp pilus assembly protein PilO
MRSAASLRPIIASIVVLGAALAFWVLLLSPKREESDKLGTQIQSLTTQVEGARSEVAQAVEARRSFPAAYHQLVVLGQAVPSNAETPSLLVELNQLAAKSHVFFESIQLEGEEASAEASAATSGTTGGTVSASEVEASLLPLGASIGSAGLGVMPYTLQFEGTYFNVSAFIGKVEALVKAGNHLAVDGRLITINSFGLATEVHGGEGESGTKASTGVSPNLKATFSVTTYLAPPGQGLNAIAPTSESSTATVAAE